VKVFLLRFDDKHSVFYSEEPEVEVASTEGGVRQWIEEKASAIQSELKKPSTRIGLHMGRLWEWLHSRTKPDESFLRRLRTAKNIEIYYPQNMDEARVKREWTSYLRKRSRSHRLWLIVNGIISPLTLLLAIIPGPNLIGYWFTYRAICHALVLFGTRQALEATTALHPVDTLNLQLAADNSENVEHVSRVFGFKELAVYLKRVLNPRRVDKYETLC
jgi:hypothetical protein